MRTTAMSVLAGVVLTASWMIRTRMKKVIWWGAAMLALSPASLPAATFSAGTNIPCAGAASQTSLPTSAFVSTGFVPCITSTSEFIGQGGATGRADSGGIGVGVEYLSGIYGSLAQAWGQIDTTFVINGPGAGPIPVSINFELSGFLGGGTGAGQVSYRQIENQAQILAYLPSGGSLAYDYYGSVLETFNYALNPGLFTTFSGPLAAPGGYCLGPACEIQSPTFEVYPGQTNSLKLWARASISSASNATAFGQASFLNTFGFDRDEPVFNLPQGYTVSVDGMNLVNNRYGGVVGSVPEPGSLALLGLGLAGLGLSRRRRAI